jgi:hypothetical protein
MMQRKSIQHTADTTSVGTYKQVSAADSHQSLLRHGSSCMWRGLCGCPSCSHYVS